MNEHEVVAALRQACEAAGSQLRWSMAKNIAPQTVNSVLRGALKPSEQIARALGIKKVTTVTYRWIDGRDGA